MASSTSATSRLHAAFGKPLYLRCEEVRKVIDETSTKELHTLFPSLISHIFGVGSNPGWGLARLARQQSQDFSALRQLLGPNGAIFRLIYKLTHDPYCRYEFPLACIPHPSRHALEEGGLPVLYADKIQMMQNLGQTYSMLTLNAFEFYFFHFAYFLVGPRGPKTSAWTQPGDALYPTLLEDYLYYFVPLDGKSVPPMPHVAAPVRSPIQTHIQRSPMYHSSNHLHMSSMLHHSMMSQSQTALGQDPQEQEIWRSQTMLQIFIEFWMNQTSLESEKYSYAQQVSENFLPSVDHVRVVRMLIKHLHYFTNSAHIEIISSPYQTTVISPMENLKRMVMPHLMQKKLYSFLRHGFERWPLDSSFRLLLEAWLSFLQPWRYEKLPRPGQPEPETGDKCVSEKWSVFIEDNLLFYTVLLQDLLPRFFRMDLTAPKNAYMLFRFAKVFSMQNLADMIAMAETTLVEPMPRLTRVHPGVTQDIGASYLSPSNRAARLNMQFAELEGPAFHYTAMFSETTSKLVKQLLILSQQAVDTMQQVIEKNAANVDSSFWGQLFSWSDSSGYHGDDDLGSSGDIRKAEFHLDTAINNLCKIFRQTRPQPGAGSLESQHGKAVGCDLSQPPDYVDTDEGRCLTPLGRYQLMNGLRRFNIEYSGDPDLQPVRSFECTFLVRMLHQLTSYINQRYGEEMKSLTERPDFPARVLSEFLHTAPPLSAKQSPGPVQSLGMLSPAASPYKTSHCELQGPRLRLRWLASYRTLINLAILYLTAYFFFNLGFVGYIFLLVLGCFLYASTKAVFKSRKSAQDAEKIKHH